MRLDLSTRVLILILITNVYLNLVISTKFIGSILLILISIRAGFEKSILRKTAIAMLFLSLPSLIYVSNYLSYFGEILLFSSSILFFSSKVFVRNELLLFAKKIFIISAVLASIILIRFIVIGSWNGNVIEYKGLSITFNPITALAVMPFLRNEIPDDLRLKAARLIMIIFVFCSDWRAVQLAFIIMLIYDYSRKYRLIKYALFVGVFFCTVGSVKYINDNKQAINSVLALNNDVTSGRAYLWTKAVNTYLHEYSIYKKVFGCGFGQFSSEINKYEMRRINIDWQGLRFTSYNKKTSASRVHAHNWFINLLYENGLVGIVFYLGLFLGGYRIYRNSRVLGIQSVVISCFIFITVAGLFNSVIYIQSIYLYFILNFVKYYVKNNRDYRLPDIR